MTEFTHLHLHTHFSQLDGYGSPKDFIKKASEIGFKSLAITDHAIIDGCFEFQNYCDKYGLKPILGSELYLVPDIKIKQKEKPFHIVLLCKNEIGWKNLCNLITKSNLDGFYKKPRIDFKLLNKHSDGFICLTACVASFLINLIENEAIKRFEGLLNVFGEDLYFEVQPHQMEKQIELNKLCLELSEKYGTKIVTTNDCHYPDKEDSKIQEIELAINQGKTWDDPKRWKFSVDGLYLKSEREMRIAFKKQGVFSKKQVSDYIANIGEIVNKCNFRLEKKSISLPDIEIKGCEGVSPDGILGVLTSNAPKDKLLRNKEYFDRLYRERDLIQSKGFSKYFLIVYDLIQFCEREKIPVGPGRGSVSGSLIAYLLGITKLDPIEHNLLFERFLSEDRINFPDIDLDFASDRRPEVFKYLKDKYGDCAQISTYMKIHSRNAIRDVGRVFNIPYIDIDYMAKVITKDMDIKTACETTNEGKSFKKKYPEIVEYAIKLDGTVRGYGRHAAGLVITDEDLKMSDKCTLIRKGKDEFAINWDMDTCEYFGLIKFDILGLSTLSIMDKCLKLIDKDIDINSISLKNQKVIKEFVKGNTTGIFQFNTSLQRKILKEVNPETFYDIVCVNALCRPGPLSAGVTDKFIKNKVSGKWDKIHERYHEITKRTYGIIIFQEQVMQLVNKLAGLTFTESDKIRKVIAKSKGKVELEKWKDKFINGCQSHSGLSKIKAIKIWKKIEGFGGYAFSVNHSTAYSYISYQMMWLKVNYSAQFIVASLTYSEDENEIQKLLDEAVEIGLNVVPPKFGKSKATEWKADDKNIYIPFNEIKGIGDKTAKELVKNEEKKKVGFAFVRVEPVDSKINGLLFEIGARREETPKDIEQYFKSIKKINNNPYKKLNKLIGTEYFNADFDDILQGLLPPEIDIELIKNKQVRFRNLECQKCSLRGESERIHYPIVGEQNVFIVGEFPDDQKIVWKEFKKYGLGKELFYQSNICKCVPTIQKKLKEIQAGICSKYLFKEIERAECRLVLVFGNVGLKTFLDIDGGIIRRSGECHWVEKIGAWVIFCIRPSSVLMDRKKNYPYFKKGIKKFVEVYSKINGNNRKLKEIEEKI